MGHTMFNLFSGFTEPGVKSGVSGRAALTRLAVLPSVHTGQQNLEPTAERRSRMGKRRRPGTSATAVQFVPGTLRIASKMGDGQPVRPDLNEGLAYARLEPGISEAPGHFWITTAS